MEMVAKRLWLLHSAFSLLTIDLLLRMYLLQCSLTSYITDDEIKKESSSLRSPGVFCIQRALIQKFHLIFHYYDEPLTSTLKKHYSIRPITARVGAAVLRAAVAEDLAEGTADRGPKELSSMSEVIY
jgi:hypothetical protein